MTIFIILHKIIIITFFCYSSVTTPSEREMNPKTFGHFQENSTDFLCTVCWGIIFVCVKKQKRHFSTFSKVGVPDWPRRRVCYQPTNLWFGQKPYEYLHRCLYTSAIWFSQQSSHQVILLKLETTKVLMNIYRQSIQHLLSDPSGIAQKAFRFGLINSHIFITLYLDSIVDSLGNPSSHYLTS